MHCKLHKQSDCEKLSHFPIEKHVATHDGLNNKKSWNMIAYKPSRPNCGENDDGKLGEALVSGSAKSDFVNFIDSNALYYFPFIDSKNNWFYRRDIGAYTWWE